MVQPQRPSATRALQFAAELGLDIRRDDFSLQLVSNRDHLIFVRVESRSSENTIFAVTDLNHSGWSIEQEAQAIELAIRLLGAERLVSVWFEKPVSVRRTSSKDLVVEQNHLSRVLMLLAQRWTAFIDGSVWITERKLGANFLP